MENPFLKRLQEIAQKQGIRQVSVPDPLSTEDREAIRTLIEWFGDTDSKEEAEFYVDSINAIGAIHEEVVGIPMFDKYIHHFMTCPNCSQEEEVAVILAKVAEFDIDILSIEEIDEIIGNKMREIAEEWIQRMRGGG